MFILSQKVTGSLRRTPQSTAARSRTSEGRREPQERSSRFPLNQSTPVHVTNITGFPLHKIKKDVSQKGRVRFWRRDLFYEVTFGLLKFFSDY